MSNLIKSNFYLSHDELKLLDAQKIIMQASKDNSDNDDSASSIDIEDDNKQLNETKKIIDDKIEAAELKAKQIVIQAEQEAELLKGSTSNEIETWWNERRLQDSEVTEQARQEGYQIGFDEGIVTSEQQVNERYTSLFVEAQSILEQAYDIQRKSLLDSEIFLLELSCGIAQKIISKQLDQSTDWIIDMVKQAIKHTSDKGVIAICVAPAQFTYIQSVRDELMHVIDPQSELHIYPDSTIQDHGCVIKTNFGTIDARVNTQLTEIKHALMDIAKRGVESVEQ